MTVDSEDRLLTFEAFDLGSLDVLKAVKGVSVMFPEPGESLAVIPELFLGGAVAVIKLFIGVLQAFGVLLVIQDEPAFFAFHCGVDGVLGAAADGDDDGVVLMAA
jgi:hypothetical protein